MPESLRAWRERLETFGREVIVEDRRGSRESLLRVLLHGCSKVYQLVIEVRQFLYDFRILRDATLGVQVIAVGNLTWGGTGKTPVVEKFARELRDQGRNVAILSRGYRSKPQPIHQWFLNRVLFRHDSTPPRVVSDGKSLLLDSEMAGDEPYMLASNLKDVVVLVDKDRVKRGRYAIEKFGCDTLLLDDGFQYWKLQGRRQDIVLIDRQQPFGTERLIPRGNLREPPSHLARASVIFITKSDGNTAELRQRIAQFNPTAGIIECVHHPLYLEDVFTGQRVGLELLKGRKGHRQRFDRGNRGRQRTGAGGRNAGGRGDLRSQPAGCVRGLSRAAGLPQRGVLLFPEHGDADARVSHRHGYGHGFRQPTRHRFGQRDDHGHGWRRRRDPDGRHRGPGSGRFACVLAEQRFDWMQPGSEHRGRARLRNLLGSSRACKWRDRRSAGEYVARAGAGAGRDPRRRPVRSVCRYRNIVGPGYAGSDHSVRAGSLDDGQHSNHRHSAHQPFMRTADGPSRRFLHMHGWNEHSKCTAGTSPVSLQRQHKL